MKFNAFHERRAGLSETVGALLSLAITIVAGAVVFGFVNGEAGVASTRYAQSVGNAISPIQEKFVIVDMNFGSSNSLTIWIYNNGQIALQLLQVRLYDSAGRINLLYNYTISGSTKTDYVYDLLSTSATKCKTVASSYESPAISTLLDQQYVTATLTLTIPNSQTGCPSFGQTFQSSVTYSVRVVGIYGNTVTYSQNR